ncbi:uncharacterized protein LOC118761255 [Octopus sinensis]|uniref:Uncharacterized protein LOC118761255 n=1 Tax=Octopus sinensis TaxID=2607531 RepID=A0A7E6EI11_9MOLL|nr:uncharacterized protein LOC118761255 [Octopus sinensis]
MAPNSNCRYPCNWVSRPILKNGVYVGCWYVSAYSPQVSQVKILYGSATLSNHIRNNKVLLKTGIQTPSNKISKKIVSQGTQTSIRREVETGTSKNDVTPVKNNDEFKLNSNSAKKHKWEFKGVQVPVFRESTHSCLQWVKIPLPRTATKHLAF